MIVSMIFSTLKHYRNINGHHPFILVCAPSNAAVDEIALRVIKKLHTLDEEERFESEILYLYIFTCNSDLL